MCPPQWTQGPPYTPEGLVCSTQPYGIMECDAGCTRTPDCKHNNQVGAPSCGCERHRLPRSPTARGLRGAVAIVQPRDTPDEPPQCWGPGAPA
jgi:hypothetical protein